MLGIRAIGLINDLEANAYGLQVLGEGDLVHLGKETTQAEGNRAIIAAGTGLGEVGMFWDGTRHLPVASEGGHADFAPRNSLERELAVYLEARFDHVSCERVVSGPGLRHIYEFLRDTGRGSEPEWLRDEMRKRDPSAVISLTALEGKSPLCADALNLFVSCYGAEAGNLALKVMAVGGMYVGGGIAPKIIAKLREGSFLEAFQDKGRMRDLLGATPVTVIMNDRAALHGAALYAAQYLN
jgi:glucokinase